MSGIDLLALAEILRRAAAAEILPRFRRLTPGQVHVKSEAIDLVTEADELAEKRIKAEVAALAPEAEFIGEESVARNGELLHRVGTADLAVVVDPVDGTANFAAGIPLFGVMAAVVRQGETVGGIIYDPMGDDWVLAEKGNGAWFRRPDGDMARLHVAAPKPLAEMVGHASTSFIPPQGRAEVMSHYAKVRIAANYRNAAHDYRTFAAGHIQFLMFHRLMPWDHLAGTLIAQEAGGHVAMLDGGSYRPGMVGGGLIAAVNPESWDLLRREVFTL